MTDQELFQLCSRIWEGQEEALLRVLEDIPDGDAWQGLRRMAGQVSRRLDHRLLAFALLHQSFEVEEAFPGQAFLAERRAARAASAAAR